VLAGRHPRYLDDVEVDVAEAAFAAGLHLGFDASAGLGIAQARDERFGPALLRPPWDGRDETGAGRRVGVHAGRDADAAGARRLDVRAELRHGAPVGLAGALEVEHHDRQAGALANLNGFVDGLDAACALVA